MDAYIDALPPQERAVMAQLRGVVTAAAPEATETIAYKMPALRLDGHFFVSYDAYKDHFSLFPASDPMIAILGDELRPHLSGKGTLRFSAREPLPADLITRIIEIRLGEFRSAR